MLLSSYLALYKDKEGLGDKSFSKQVHRHNIL